MRCPTCLDEYEPHVRRCAACGVALVPEGAPTTAPRPDARLGRFDPTVADAVLSLLDERELARETVTRDGAIEVLVAGDRRDDLRTELALTWDEVVRRLPEEQVGRVVALGGQSPGWLDPPRGGWVDRQGRMVVDAADDEEADRARTIGPTLAVAGGVLLLLSWYAGLGQGLVFAGIGLALVGLLLPR
jgi:hypothetical protein